MWEGKDSEEKKLANVTIKKKNSLLDRPAKAEHSTRLVPFLNMNTDISLSTISNSTTNIPNEKSSNFLSACVYFRPELETLDSNSPTAMHWPTIPCSATV